MSDGNVDYEQGGVDTSFDSDEMDQNGEGTSGTPGKDSKMMHLLNRCKDNKYWLASAGAIVLGITIYWMMSES